MSPRQGRRAFPDYPEPPRVLFDRKSHRPPRDLEDCAGYWLISDRAKQLFETLNSRGFAFFKCETRFTNGESGPDYFLCDVVRELDALDEQASRRFEIRHDSEGRKYSFKMDASLVFKEDVVGAAHIFHVAYFGPVICDQSLRDAWKAAGLKGIWFHEVFHPEFDEIGTITALPRHPNSGTVRLGRRKEALFHGTVLEAFGGSLNVGDTVRAIGQYDRNYRFFRYIVLSESEARGALAVGSKRLRC
jgi:Protein of unknown function (DUF1629)